MVEGPRDRRAGAGLARTGGDRRRFGFTPDLAGYNHERRATSLAQIVDLILSQRDAAEPWSIYAGALPVDRHLPGFKTAHAMPLLADDREMLISLWLGNRARTAIHWDLPQNLACVVAGRRRFTLFPIEQVANLYVGPLDRTLAGQPSSLVDPAAPDFARFPRYADALACAETAELGPGDALYLPSLWWHGVESLDPFGAMINFWWRDGNAATQHSPLLALFHALMTMADLPPAELARWRVLFDHYLFGAGDPARASAAGIGRHPRRPVGGDAHAAATAAGARIAEQRPRQAGVNSAASWSRATRALLTGWCGQEDSNFHGLSATTTSTLRVYQFRHGRTTIMSGGQRLPSGRGGRLAEPRAARNRLRRTPPAAPHPLVRHKNRRKPLPVQRVRTVAHRSGALSWTTSTARRGGR